jgi:1,4-alpha-glucan branching enzyme
VLSLIRQGDGQSLVCVFNFTPVPREAYRIGLSQPGSYREILNTDAERYGGGNVGNAGLVVSSPEPWNNRPHSATLQLPPLGAVFLIYEEHGPG